MTFASLGSIGLHLVNTLGPPTDKVGRTTPKHGGRSVGRSVGHPLKRFASSFSLSALSFAAATWIGVVGGVHEIPGNCVPVPTGLPPGRHEVVRFDLRHLAGEVGERLLHVARREGAAPPRVEQRLQWGNHSYNFEFSRWLFVNSTPRKRGVDKSAMGRGS